MLANMFRYCLFLPLFGPCGSSLLNFSSHHPVQHLSSTFIHLFLGKATFSSKFPHPLPFFFCCLAFVQRVLSSKGLPSEGRSLLPTRQLIFLFFFPCYFLYPVLIVSFNYFLAVTSVSEGILFVLPVRGQHLDTFNITSTPLNVLSRLCPNKPG